MASLASRADGPHGKRRQRGEERAPETAHRDFDRSAFAQHLTLQALIDLVPDYLYVKDVQSRFVVANKALVTDSGRETVDELIGLSDFELHAPELAKQFRAAELRVLLSGHPMIDDEEFIVDQSGRKKWFSSTKVPLRNTNGEVIGLIGIARDITARKQAETLRDGQARILEKIAKGSPLADVLERLVSLVEAQLDGISGSILLIDKDGLHLAHGAAPSLPESYTSLVDGLAIGPKAGSCGTAAYRRERVIVSDIMQDPLWEDYRELAAAHNLRSCWSTPILAQDGAVLGLFAMYSATVREPTRAELELVDFTTHIAGIAIQRKIAEDRIQFMANHDVLTGLPNRALLTDRLSQAILFGERYKRLVATVFIDLDNFKLVNDTLGHNAGDELLRTMAHRMQAVVGAMDTVVRFGGDEFVIVLADQPRNTRSIGEAVRKIRAAISEPISIGTRTLTATASIGVAIYPSDGEDADTLLANADAAMYHAKQTGRDNFQFYVPRLKPQIQDKLSLREELREALAEGQFELFYQPQLDIRSNRIFAAEALLRWNHPKRGHVPPGDFVPLAEESGLIIELGDWVLHQACRQNKAWQNAGLQPISVSVNVSARQFRDRHLIDSVTSALKDSGLRPDHLELELTESLIMQDIEHAVAMMGELNELGVRISIDDFGTGYSSLNSLKTFPVSRLKIDKSFVRDLATSESDRAVTSAVIALGQKLKLHVVAEGVETAEQLEFLRRNNCDEIQGYLFSRPVPAEEFTTMLGSKGAIAGSAAKAE